MSKMRWADSDSDSEEEYIPPPQPDPEPEPAPVDDFVRDAPSSPRGGGGGWGGHGSSPGGYPHNDRRNSAPYNHHHQPRNDYNNHAWRGGGGGGGRGGAPPGRGGGGPGDRRQSHPTGRSNYGGGNHGGGGGGGGDWKQMAKASSRISASGPGTVDGSSWMAQRRAKQQQEEEESRKRLEEARKQAEEEKRERRRSQLNALKAAMQEIKVETADQPVPGSNLHTAASKTSQKAPSSPGSSSPVRILKREPKQNDHQGGQQWKHERQTSTQTSGGGYQQDSRHSIGSAKPLKDSDIKAWRRSSAPPAHSKIDDKRSDTPQQSVPKYNYTINDSSTQKTTNIISEEDTGRPNSQLANPPPPIPPKPKAELQPDGSVKFIRKPSSNIGTKGDKMDQNDSGADRNNTDHNNTSSKSTEQHTPPERTNHNETTNSKQHLNYRDHEHDEASYNSGGSRGSYGGRGRGRGRGRGGTGRGQGRGRGRDHKGGRGSGAVHDENSVSSNLSGRGSRGGRGRGGGRGRDHAGRRGGRGRHDSAVDSVPKHVVGHDQSADTEKRQSQGPKAGRGSHKGRGRGRGRGRDNKAARGGRGHYDKESMGADNHLKDKTGGKNDNKTTNNESNGKTNKSLKSKNKNSFEIGK